MQHLIFVAECGPFEKLIHKATNGFRIEGATIPMLIHVFLEVLFAKLKDKNELCLAVDDVVEADNIGVFKLLHQGYFTYRRRWSSFLGIQVNFFQCNNLVRGTRSSLMVEN